jgi:hypothetical protein
MQSDLSHKGRGEVKLAAPHHYAASAFISA